MSDINNHIKELDHVLDDWQICDFCKIVDKDRERSTVGHACNICGKPSKGGIQFFDPSVYLLIDLIKEAFETEHKINYPDTIVEYKLNTHYISVLLFFCTLRELLLNSLIWDICLSKKIPEDICSRLNLDYKLHVQKQDKLFKILTGVKWTTALAEIDSEHNKNYTELNKNIKELVNLRNKFSHKGSSWNIDKSTGINCITNIVMLIHLYVDLNNKYVHII